MRKHFPCQALEQQLAKEQENQAVDDSVGKRPVVTPGVIDDSPAKPRALFTPDRVGPLLDHFEDAQLPLPASPSPGPVLVDPYADTYVDVEAASDLQDALVACPDKASTNEVGCEKINLLERILCYSLI